MSYLPIFYSMENKKLLLIGAGNIASKKLENLLEFTRDITIIAPKISEYINLKANDYNLNIINRDYSCGDIKGFDIVIVVVDNLKLQKEIYFECKKQNILCNCADLQEYCDFIFPSYIKEGDLTIAISTNGSSPSFSKNFKLYLKNLLPKDINVFLVQMRELRKELPKGKDRMKFLDNKVKEYIKSWN